MFDKSAVRMGGTECAFKAPYLASGVVAWPVGAVRVGIEGGVGGRELMDLVNLARCRILFYPSLLVFSRASSELLCFAALIVTPLAFLATMSSSFFS